MSQPTHSADSATPAGDASALMRAALRLCLGLARILVGRLPWNTLVDTLKQAYVQEARRQLERDTGQRRVTRSALSAVTGIDARQIAALEKSSEQLKRSSNVDAFVTTIEQWAIDPQWHDTKGNPSELPIYGSGATFQTLVRHAAGNNVTPQTVLQRLLEHGNVEYVEDGKAVRLVNRYYMPVRWNEMNVLETGSLSHIRLSATLDHNARATRKEDLLLQQDRWVCDIPESAAPEAIRTLREIMERNIAEAEAYLEDLEQRTEAGDGPKIIIGSGWFVFADENESPENHD